MPGRSPRIEVDPVSGAIAIHDTRSKLRRAFLFWWGFAVAGLLLIAICVAAVGLYFAVESDGHHHGAHSKYLGKAFIAIVAGIVTGIGMIATGLYRQARMGFRYFDPHPDLILSPAGMDDPWLGVGVIPWDRIEGAELRVHRRYNHRLGIVVKIRDLQGWLATLPDTKWMSILTRFKLADQAAGTFWLSQTGGETFGACLRDVMFALACFVPVTGLPPGFRPENLALQALRPPAVNLYRPPELSLDEIDLSPLELRADGGKAAAMALYLGGLAAIVAASLAFMSMALALTVIAWIMLCFLAWGAFMYAACALMRQPVMIADPEGITLSSYSRYGRISWTEVVDVANLPGERGWSYFHVTVFDLEARDRHLPWLARMIYRSRRLWSSTLKVRLYHPVGSMQLARERLLGFRVHAMAAGWSAIPQDGRRGAELG